MSLACNYNNVSGASEQRSHPDGCATVRDYYIVVLLYPGFDVLYNCCGIFVPRVVRGHYHEVAHLRSNTAHLRPLSLIPVAAAAKDGYDFTLSQILHLTRYPAGIQKLPRGFQQPLKRVMSMCIIDDGQERLSKVYALESALHYIEGGYALRDGHSRNTQWQSGADR